MGASENNIGQLINNIHESDFETYVNSGNVLFDTTNLNCLRNRSMPYISAVGELSLQEQVKEKIGLASFFYLVCKNCGFRSHL